LEVDETTGSIKILFKKHWAAKYKIGQYVFLNFPQLSLLEWHPFTLASGPNEPFCEVLIKSLGDHTKKLLEKAKANKSLWIRVDGPYGKWPFNFARYNTAVLIAGGVGVTPSMALIRHIYHINRVTNEVDPYLQDVFLLWACKNEREFKWYRRTLEEAMKRSAQNPDTMPKLHIFVHITQPNVSWDFPIYVKPERPEMSKVFDQIEQIVTLKCGKNGFRASVVACGPAAMVNSAWDQTNKRTRNQIRYDFHHETFEF
jgi:predicted ferric reductase